MPNDNLKRRIYQYSTRIASQALVEKDLVRLSKINNALSLLAIASNIDDESYSERLIRSADKLSNF